MAPRRAYVLVALLALLVANLFPPVVRPQAISVSTINDRTLVGNTYVATPKVYLTVACNAGSSFTMLATETNTTTGEASSKIVTVSCFGSVHSWALRPVTKVPARTAVFQVLADINSDLLAEASPNATVQIIKEQQARGAGIVYLPAVGSGEQATAFGGNCTYPNGTWCGSVVRDQATRAAQINVILGILSTLDTIQRTLQSLSNQINNIQLQIDSLVSSQLQLTEAQNQQGQLVRTMAGQMQAVAGTVRGLTLAVDAVTSAVEANAATSDLNDRTLNENINGLGDALVDSNVLQTNALATATLNIKARIDAGQQLLAQQLLRAIANVVSYVQNVEFTGQLTNAQTVSKLTANIDDLRQLVQTLVAQNAQHSKVISSSQQAVQALAQLELYHGTLERDYHVALSIMDSMGLVGYLGTRGVPPTNLAKDHLLMGMRTALIGVVSLVTPQNDGSVVVQNCPQPMTIAPLKDAMDSVYMNVTLPGVSVDYAIDQTFLRYNETVVVAVTNTITPNNETTWLYLSYSYCAANSIYCGTCAFSLALCLSPNLEDAAKFVLQYNPLSPNTSTVLVQGQQTAVLKPALASLGAYRVRVTGTDMCLSPAQTPANATSLFNLQLTDGSLLQNRLLRWDDVLAFSMPNVSPSGTYLTFASETCLTQDTNPTYRTFVRLLPSFAWGGVTPLGRDVSPNVASPALFKRDPLSTSPRTGIAAAGGMSALQQRIADFTAPYRSSRRTRGVAAVEVRSPPNTCPVSWDYTNSPTVTGVSATNVTACVSTPGCIMTYYSNPSWALIGHMTGWDGRYTLSGTTPFTYPDLGPYDVSAIAEVSSNQFQIATTAVSTNASFNFAGAYMTAYNASVPGTPFQLLTQSAQSNVLVNMGPSPQVYIAKLTTQFLMLGVPRGQRIVIRTQGSDVTQMAPWSTPMSFAAFATPSTGNGPLGDNVQNGIPRVTTQGLYASYYDWQNSQWVSSGTTTGTVTLKADPTKDITYYRYPYVGPVGRYCCLSSAAAPCNDAIRTTKSANPALTETQFYGFVYPGPVVDILGNVKIYCKLNPSYVDPSYSYPRSSGADILPLPNTTYSRSQVFQIPGIVTITVQPDPEVTTPTYSGRCVRNSVVSGSTTFYQRFCTQAPAQASIEYCTGRSCGQNYTEYYDLVSYDVSTTGKGPNPARGYAVATWYNKNYFVTIQPDPTCNAAAGCNTTFTDTGSEAGANTGLGVGMWGGSIKGTIKVGYKRTTTNIFTGVQATATQPTDSNLGVVPFTGFLTTCAAACHELTDQTSCLNNPGSLCTWRYFRQYSRSYCMNYAFDLNTSCQQLTAAACVLPQYTPFCALGVNGTCVRGTTIAGFNSSVPAQRYLGECRYVAGRPDPLGMNVLGANGCTLFNTMSVLTAWGIVGYDQGNATDIRYYRACTFNRNTCQGEDFDVTQSSSSSFIPCYLRYAVQSPTEFNCIRNTYPAVPLTGGGDGSILPYCTYIQPTPTSTGRCTLANGINVGNPSLVYNNFGPAECFAIGAYCNTETTPYYPNNANGTSQYNMYKTWGYAFGGACTTNPTYARSCSDYNNDMAGCVLKNLCVNKSPMQRCEPYLGQCTQPCALFNGDVTGCINNVNGKCYYLSDTRTCTQVTSNFQGSNACANGNCVYINTPCNQFYANETGCVLDSRCTWIHYDPSTPLTSYCEQSSNVAFGSCVNGTAGVPMRYCDIGNGDPLNTTLTALENNCSPQSVGQHISITSCMGRNDQLGNPCVYVYSGGGVKGACTGPTDPTCAFSSCFAANDPNILKITDGFPALSIRTITRDDYLASLQTGSTIYQGVTLQWLRDNILIPEYELDVANLAVFSTLSGVNTGLRLVPDDIKAFYPCPTDSLGNAMVNSGGFCCSLSEYNAYLDTCSGPSRMVNDLHPDNVYKVAFAEYCAANSNVSGSTTVAVFNRTVNVYYLAHSDPDPSNPQYAVDTRNCPILLLDQNRTTTVAVGNATVYPYIELAVAKTLGIFERLQWLYPLCVIEYSLGSLNLTLVRISESTLDALANYYSYYLYNSTTYNVAEFSDIYGNMNGGGIDLLPLNISGLPIPGFKNAVAADMRARTNVLLTQYRDLSNVYVSAGLGTRILRLGGSETDTGKTIAQWELRFGAFDPRFVDVLLLNAHTVECSMTLNITDVRTGISVVYDQPRTCTMVSSYAQMIPADYTYLVHAPITINGVDRIIVAPNSAIDVESPYEASQGKATCFRTLDATSSSMDYQTFSKMCPTCDWRCFSNSLSVYTKARDKDKFPAWQDDFCGVLSGTFENAEDLDYVLGISMLREQGFTALADAWVAENRANPDDEETKLQLFTDLQANEWPKLGCTRTLTNFCDLSTVVYTENGNTTNWAVQDLFSQIWAVYKELIVSYNYTTVVAAISETILQPIAQSGTSIYCGNCGGVAQKSCTTFGYAVPIRSVMGASNQWCALSQILQLHHDDVNQKLLGIAVSTRDDYVATWLVPGNLQFESITVAGCPSSISGVAAYTPPSLDTRLATLRMFNPSQTGTIVVELRVTALNCSSLDIITIAPLGTSTATAQVCYGDYQITLRSQYDGALCLNVTGNLNETLASQLLSEPQTIAIQNAVRSEILENLQQLSYDTAAAVWANVSSNVLQTTTAQLVPVYATVANLNGSVTALRTFLVGSANTPLPNITLPTIVNNFDSRISQQDTNLSRVSDSLGYINNVAGDIIQSLTSVQETVDTQQTQLAQQQAVTQQRFDVVQQQAYKDRLTTSTLVNTVANQLQGITGFVSGGVREYSAIGLALAALLIALPAFGITLYLFIYTQKYHLLSLLQGLHTDVRTYLGKGQPPHNKNEPFVAPPGPPPPPQYMPPAPPGPPAFVPGPPSMGAVLAYGGGGSASGPSMMSQQTAMLPAVPATYTTPTVAYNYPQTSFAPPQQPITAAMALSGPPITQMQPSAAAVMGGAVAYGGMPPQTPFASVSMTHGPGRGRDSLFGNAAPSYPGGQASAEQEEGDEVVWKVKGDEDK